MLKYNNKTIYKVYKNNKIIKKAYKQGNTVFEYKDKYLPQGYQECKFIESSGTQYVKTNFIPSDYNGNYTVMIDFQGISLLGSSSYMAGCGGVRSCNMNVNTSGGISIYNNNMAETGAGTGASIESSQFNILERNKIKVTLINDGYTTAVLNGVSYSNEIKTKTASTSYFVLGRSSGTNYPIKLYGCKIYDGNNDLIRHFIPCLDNNNVPCLYERILGETLYNTGAGTFTYELL